MPNAARRAAGARVLSPQDGRSDLPDTLAAHAPPGFNARVEAYFVTFVRGDDRRWSEIEITLDDAEEELTYTNARLKTALRLDPERIARVVIRARHDDAFTQLATDIDAVRRPSTRAEVRLERRPNVA